jgi:hypothetical protein
MKKIAPYFFFRFILDDEAFFNLEENAKMILDAERFYRALVTKVSHWC